MSTFSIEQTISTSLHNSFTLSRIFPMPTDYLSSRRRSVILALYYSLFCCQHDTTLGTIMEKRPHHLPPFLQPLISLIVSIFSHSYSALLCGIFPSFFLGHFSFSSSASADVLVLSFHSFDMFCLSDFPNL